MVSSKLFYQVHKRMNEIFCPEQDTPFGGIYVLVCGVLYPLPPVRAKPVFTINETESMEALIYWRKFRLAELDHVMHQDDEMLLNQLNKIRLRKIDQNIEHIIKSRFTEDDQR